MAPRSPPAAIILTAIILWLSPAPIYGGSSDETLESETPLLDTGLEPGLAESGGGAVVTEVAGDAATAAPDIATGAPYSATGAPHGATAATDGATAATDGATAATDGVWNSFIAARFGPAQDDGYTDVTPNAPADRRTQGQGNGQNGVKAGQDEDTVHTNGQGGQLDVLTKGQADRSKSPVFNIWEYAMIHGPAHARTGGTPPPEFMSDRGGLNRCEWAVVSCCVSPSRRRQHDCFEGLHCTGAWFGDPCSVRLQQAVYELLLQQRRVGSAGP